MGMLLVLAQLGFCQVKDNAAFLCTVKIKYKNGDQSWKFFSRWNHLSHVSEI